MACTCAGRASQCRPPATRGGHSCEHTDRVGWRHTYPSRGGQRRTGGWRARARAARRSAARPPHAAVTAASTPTGSDGVTHTPLEAVSGEQADGVHVRGPRVAVPPARHTRRSQLRAHRPGRMASHIPLSRRSAANRRMACTCAGRASQCRPPATRGGHSCEHTDRVGWRHTYPSRGGRRRTGGWRARARAARRSAARPPHAAVTAATTATGSDGVTHTPLEAVGGEQADGVHVRGPRVAVPPARHTRRSQLRPQRPGRMASHIPLSRRSAANRRMACTCAGRASQCRPPATRGGHSCDHSDRVGWRHTYPSRGGRRRTGGWRARARAARRSAARPPHAAVTAATTATGSDGVTHTPLEAVGGEQADGVHVRGPRVAVPPARHTRRSQLRPHRPGRMASHIPLSRRSAANRRMACTCAGRASQCRPPATRGGHSCGHSDRVGWRHTYPSRGGRRRTGGWRARARAARRSAARPPHAAVTAATTPTGSDGVTHTPLEAVGGEQADGVHVRGPRVAVPPARHTRRSQLRAHRPGRMASHIPLSRRSAANRRMACTCAGRASQCRPPATRGGHSCEHTDRVGWRHTYPSRGGRRRTGGWRARARAARRSAARPPHAAVTAATTATGSDGVTHTPLEAVGGEQADGVHVRGPRVAVPPARRHAKPRAAVAHREHHAARHQLQGY
ncbi:serine/arginine repetitive matrix protein 5-like [Ostrinia nubilalis]|uniref:serine/arginine repetitive matrix protein 5-like n=1 Tax=Ostrinia nubilalis TaxID=29057 RepID=UPI003082567A